MLRCAGIKPNGQRCTVEVGEKQTHCWAHDPRYAEQRRRRASKGGKAKANAEVRELHALLASLTDRVIGGDLSTAAGAVANQLITTRIKLLEYERRLKETEEFEERLRALEVVRRAG
jgi:hypothetical protein